MVSQSRSLACFINLFGAERIGTKPDFFLSHSASAASVAPILVLNNGGKSSIPDSEQGSRIALGCGDGRTDGKKGSIS